MRDWLSHRVAATPNATALVRAADGESWTYDDLDRLVDGTAGRLAAFGIDSRTTLGIHLAPQVGYVGLIHAAMRLGATFVPIGHDLTPREIADRAEAADVDDVVCGAETEATAVEALSDADVRVLSVDDPDRDGVHAVHDADPGPIGEPTWTFADTLCLLFTSGTGGRPKPVEVTAGNAFFSAVASAFRLGVRRDDRWLLTLPLHHAGGLSPVLRTVLYGTTIVLREGFDPGGAADDVDRYDVTGVSLVPTMLTRMLDSRGTLSDSIRAVLLGGAPASEQLVERCENYSIPVYPTYGMTETASQITTATPEEAFDHPGTVGRPLMWTDLTVVDDDGDPVETGEVGEFVVAGPTVTLGYHDMPEANDAAFGPFGLHTGDVGRVDADGYVHVLNRRDDRIITGGENVEPGEVAAILRSHPDVEDVAVVGIDDETWGERVGALIVPANDGSDDAEGSNRDDGHNGPAEPDRDDGRNDADEPTHDGDELPAESDTGNEGDDRPSLDESNPTDEPVSMDERDLIEHARSELAAFKLPRTIAYAADLPRTVSGTVDRSAARARLEERGEPVEVPEIDFDEAGFEPADPKPARDGATDAEAGRNADGDDGDDPDVVEGDVAVAEDDGGDPDADRGDPDVDGGDPIAADEGGSRSAGDAIGDSDASDASED
ncbi:class I adenylate-forming enzyme family protein [Halopenitus salinus]|uniref:Class I adenylate-forming enzyme family protein n=1 Tax=Halopenitus salinus TaxID=1198295 RepID=A0ABD5URN0_9EURY